jgi:voltage-gated potassium channel
MLRAPTLHSLRRSRFLFLVLALVVVLLVSPFLDNSPVHEAYFIVLFALIMLSAVRIASDRRGHRIFALALGVPWLLLSLSDLVLRHPEITIGANLLFIVFNIYVLGIVLGEVVSAAEIDFDILLGACAVYLLIGIIWTVSYVVIHALDPAAFSLIQHEARPLFHQFLYFSLTTLTTLGYGDITPLNPFAQIWATMEAVVGTLYIALLVARLVGMYQSRRPPRH